MVVATVASRYFEKSYETLARGADASTALFRADAEVAGRLQSQSFTGVLAEDAPRAWPALRHLLHTIADRAPEALADEARSRENESDDVARTRLLVYWAGDVGSRDDYLSRALLHSLVCGLQARFRTFPGNNILGTRGFRVSWIKVGGQKRRVEVPLHRANAAGAGMPALGERLFDVRLTAVTVLGQFGAARGEFAQGAAGACNRASQLL